MLAYVEGLLAKQGEILAETGFLGAIAGQISLGEGSYSGLEARESLAVEPAGVAGKGEAEASFLEKAGETGGEPEGDSWVLPLESGSWALSKELAQRMLEGEAWQAPLDLVAESETLSVEMAQGAGQFGDGWVRPLDQVAAREESRGAVPLERQSALVSVLEEEASPYLLERLEDILPSASTISVPRGEQTSAWQEGGSWGTGEGQSLETGGETQGWRSSYALEQGGEGLSVSRMDRAIERDARRYDGRI